MKKYLLSKQPENLLVVGSVAFDSISTPFGSVNKSLGGSASYFSLAGSYFVRPAVIGVVGDDFKKQHFDVLKKHGVDVSAIKKQKGKTFHWAGEYHFDLNTRDTLKTELGVFANFSPVLDDAQKKSDYIFLGNIHPSLQLSVLRQIKKPKLVGLDTMNLWIDTALNDLKKVLRQVDVFVINDSEARQLSKETNIYKAAKKILGMMDTASLKLRRINKKNKCLIIKRGEYGLLMFSQNQIFHLPGLPLENVVDPTGAGDSFAGGLFGYLAARDNLSINTFKHACVYGTALASFCVENFGTTMLQNLSKKQIDERAKQLHQLVKI